MSEDPEERPSDRDLGVLASGAGISLLGRIANGGLVFAYGVVLARLLEVRDVGAMLLGLTLIRVAELLSRMGLEFGALHFVAIANGDGRSSIVRATVRNAVRFGLLFSVFVSLGLVAGAPVLARVFELPELAVVLRTLALSLPLTSTTMILLAALLGLKEVVKNTLGEKIALPGINLILCTLLLAAGLELNGASMAYVAAALFTMPLAAYFFHRSAPLARSPSAPVPAMELLRFSVPVVLVVMCTDLLAWTDTIMLGLLRPADEVGIYGSAMRVAIIAGMFTASFCALFVPTISDLYNRGEMRQLGYLYKAVGKWIFLATLPVFFVVMLLAPNLMLLFGPAYVPGSAPLVVLTLTQLVAACGGAVSFMLMMSGRQKLILVDALFACVLNLALNAALIPRFGMLGAASATCISIAAFNAMALVQVWRTMEMHPYHWGYAKILAVGAIAFLAVSWLRSEFGASGSATEFALYSAGYLALYLVILLATGMDAEDKVILDKLRRKLDL